MTMQLSLMTDSLGSLSFQEMVEKASQLGFEALEFGTGNWSQAPHLDLDLLLSSSNAREDFVGTLQAHHLSISALNCSGNILAPNEMGKKHQQVMRKTFMLSTLLGVKHIVMMSGLPGGGPEEHLPNWITTSWPLENLEVLSYQWNDCLIPFWKELVKEAQDQGVEQIALENHGCQLVYNCQTLKRLREAVGPMVGMNLDPSHLFWMGGDPMAMARSLQGMLYHVHAKDVRIERVLSGAEGLLDTSPIEDYAKRTWNYVALGYGHDLLWWKEFFSVLTMVGYDGPVSLEMEDKTMSQVTGTCKSLEVLKAALPRLI